MTYSLRQAAKACGRSRTTIHRALKSGKMSGVQDENKEWSIDPAELQRVFPWDRPEHEHRSADGHRSDTQSAVSDVLEVKVAMLEQQLEREQETVADLRKRLDRAEDRVVALTDQRGIGDNKGWLGRLLSR